MPSLTRESVARQATVRLSESCSVSRLIAGMDADSAAVLAESFANRSVTGAAIYRALIDGGYEDVPKPGTLQRHRKGECSCRS